MPSSIVYDIKVDKHNRIWIATFGGGIACYDGIKFKIINEDIGLSKDLIRSISIDDATGEIYVGAQGAFDLITKDSIKNLSNLLNSNTESNVSIASVKGNTTYISTQEAFMTFVNLKKESTIKVTNANNYLFDKDHNLWLTNKNNLFIKLANGELVNYNLEYGANIEGASDVKKYKNYTLVATKNGIYVFEKLKLIKIINQKNGLPDDYIRCLLVDGNTLWIGTRIGLVKTSDLINFTLFDSKNGIDRGEIKCMSLDKNGLLWVGTTTNGLFKMIKSDIVKYTLGVKPIAFTMDYKKNLYALVKNGIKFFNQDSNKFVNYMHLEGFDNLKYFCFDKNNAIYLTMGDKGIAKLVPPNKKTIFEYKLARNDNPASYILSDNDFVWMAYKRRLLKYNIRTNRIDTIGNKKGDSQYFQDILKVDTTIWIASANGINTLSADTFVLITDHSIKNFPAGIVNNLEQDKYKHVWLAADRGLYCLEGKEAFSNLRKDGFPTNEIADIAIVDTFLFAATNKGLIQVAIKPNNNKNCTYQIINKRNGLTDFDLTNKALFSDSTYVWIAYDNGAYRYRPSNQIKNEVPIYISNVNSDFGSLVFKQSKNFTNQIVDLKKQLNLNYTENEFTIEFNGINYSLADNVYYSFRLLGLNPNWSIPSSETKAVYTNLSPGEYVFELSASNGKTNFGDVISYKIYISPPFYQTWWFKTLIIIVILIIISFVIRFRIRSIKEQNTLLEAKVKDRTKELNVKSLELESSNHELLHKSKLINESLEYAKKIQESILPSQNFLDKQFENIVNTAALYLPKDIVSGDFYYTYRKNNFNYFALVDCTGHGVPGALLSFSVNSVLHSIVDNLLEYKEPSDILKKVIDGFSEIYIRENEVKESFAISLVCYLQDSKKMYFSGISQSISLFSKGELTEIKSQNSFLIINKNDFASQEFAVEKGDRIYFYSDGYYDQKSETTNRRMYKSGLYKHIIATKNLSLAEQTQSLKNNFLKFKGNKEQIDDVTLFVVEIQ